MNRHFRHLVAFALLLGAVPCLAATPGMQYDQNGFNPRMLDASVPQAERMKLFAHVVKLAEQGQVPAMDLAGTMFWQGSKIAGSPVKTNLEQAHKLLAYAAVHGDVMAMAKISEMELAAGKTTKAMVWAQLYAHYLDPTRHAREDHGRRYNYASDLMQRIEQAGGKVNATVSKDASQMVARFDKPVRAGIMAFKHQRRNGHTHLVVQPISQSVDRDKANLNGVSDFMVAFNPDGSIKQVWLLGAWPTDTFADMLRPWLDHARANDAHGDTAVRYLEVPITYNALKGKALRAHH